MDNYAWLLRNDLSFFSVHRASVHHCNNHAGGGGGVPLSQSNQLRKRFSNEWIPFEGGKPPRDPRPIVSWNFVGSYCYMSLLTYWSTYHWIVGRIGTKKPSIINKKIHPYGMATFKNSFDVISISEQDQNSIKCKFESDQKKFWVLFNEQVNWISLWLPFCLYFLFCIKWSRLVLLSVTFTSIHPSTFYLLSKLHSFNISPITKMH